jgi:hypothetical protein
LEEELKLLLSTELFQLLEHSYQMLVLMKQLELRRQARWTREANRAALHAREANRAALHARGQPNPFALHARVLERECVAGTTLAALHVHAMETWKPGNHMELILHA